MSLWRGLRKIAVENIARHSEKLFRQQIMDLEFNKEYLMLKQSPECKYIIKKRKGRHPLLFKTNSSLKKIGQRKVFEQKQR